jgi:hypothetical protein
MKDKARWMELCEQAASEQDPQKLMELVEEINRLLLEKEKRVGIVLPPRSESTLFKLIIRQHLRPSLGSRSAGLQTNSRYEQNEQLPKALEQHRTS